LFINGAQREAILLHIESYTMSKKSIDWKNMKEAEFIKRVEKMHEKMDRQLDEVIAKEKISDELRILLSAFVADKWHDGFELGCKQN